jgi:4-hydroxyphenylpyruvate dioxygenase
LQKGDIGMTSQNYLDLDGIEFVEFSSPEPTKLHQLFLEFGFSRLMRHKNRNIDLYRQGEIVFLLNTQPDSYASEFQKLHGPSISAMGWRVRDSQKALKTAVERGAKAAEKGVDYQRAGHDFPCIYGIGRSLIYLVDDYGSFDRLYKDMGFVALTAPDIVADKGFTFIDHLTNNVYQGEMEQWSNFYKNVFGFTEVRYFDIRGVKTGLISYALRSPCGKFSIPINEGTESKSQINEYLDEYKGPGVQHLALATNDIISSIQALQSTSVETLDIDDEYYQEVFDRVPNVTEDRQKIETLKILVDGDEEGYLLQIFTKNIIGPIFFEIIQRKNHHAFGEGNFGALFRSIERDQAKRGYLD